MTVKKAIKKPVIIDYLVWTGRNQREIYGFLEGCADNYGYIGRNHYIDHEKINGGLVIKTLEGDITAPIGAHIMKGPQGGFYPCDSDAFKLTYDDHVA